MEIGNLNPRYTLLSYDINLMKNIIKSIDTEELLSTCPHTTIPIDTLFYHFDDENYEINKTPQFTDNHYYFNFIGQYNLIKNKDISMCQVLWNRKELKLLDLSLISIELGFNPTMYYYKNPNTQ